MATESPCSLRIGREQFNGTARLDLEHIDFAGTTKFRFRFSEIRNPGEIDGELSFDFHGNTVRMDIGARTEKWLESILHPKTVSDKLGIRAGLQVRFVDFEDGVLKAEIAQKAARLQEHDASELSDVIVLQIERPAELRQLRRLSECLTPDGAIWVLLQKTSKTVSHANVMAAARSVDLAVTKSVSYSEALSADRITGPAEGRSPARATGAGRGASRSPRRRRQVAAKV